eukprot:51565-Eustigmatos_ZCMA.PRE.1
MTKASMTSRSVSSSFEAVSYLRDSKDPRAYTGLTHRVRTMYLCTLLQDVRERSKCAKGVLSGQARDNRRTQ